MGEGMITVTLPIWISWIIIISWTLFLMGMVGMSWVLFIGMLETWWESDRRSWKKGSVKRSWKNGYGKFEEL